MRRTIESEKTSPNKTKTRRVLVDLKIPLEPLTFDIFNATSEPQKDNTAGVGSGARCCRPGRPGVGNKPRGPNKPDRKKLTRLGCEEENPASQ